jgi:hypothetical protein
LRGVKQGRYGRTKLKGMNLKVERYLGKGKLVVEDEGGDEGSNEKVLDFEGIEIRIVRRSERSFHEIKDIDRTSNEETFHQSIIKRYPRPKQIFHKHVLNDHHTGKKDQ